MKVPEASNYFRCATTARRSKSVLSKDQIDV